ncbi:MAG TPA: AI-2E family transporter [Vicinamibacteria bacterium]
MPERLHTNWRVQGPLLGFLLVTVVLAFVVFRYFLLTFTVAASVALMLSPLQGALSRRLGRRDGLAASLLVLGVMFVILVPVFLYGALIFQQAVAFLDWLRPHLEAREWDRFWREVVPQRSPKLANWLRQIGWEAPPLTAGLARASEVANHYVQVVLTGVATVALDLVIFLMMLFFLLRDGDDLRESLRGISPFTRGQESELLEHLGNTVKAVLQAMIIVPLIQGVVAFFGFWAFGLPSPLLWAVMVVFAALIPILGSPLAWIPAALYFLVNGHMGLALGMTAYGVFVISMVDNIVKPMILRGSAQIHMMLGFLSIMGGLIAFGPKGLIVGPVVLSLVLSAYRIYRYDILRWREEEGMGATIMAGLPPPGVPIAEPVAAPEPVAVAAADPRVASR